MESRPVLAVLIILLGAFAWGVLGFFNKMQVTRDNKKIAESKFMELKTQQEKLSSDIAKLQTEKGVEENIRDKFGLAKEGEGLIVVLDDKDNKEAEALLRALGMPFAK